LACLKSCLLLNSGKFALNLAKHLPKDRILQNRIDVCWLKLLN
jgi:hypothetical protein